MARGLLMLSPLPLPTTALVAMDHTAMARGPLMPRLTTAMEAMVRTATARGLLMPRLTTAMEAMVHMATARGLLMLRLTTAMAATAHTATARGLLMPMLTTAMADTALMAMARGPLMPMLTMAMLATVDPMATESALLMLTTDMAAMAFTDMPSKLRELSPKEKIHSESTQSDQKIPKVQRTDVIGEFCNLLN